MCCLSYELRGSDAVRGLSYIIVDVPRNVRRDHSSPDDLAGLVPGGTIGHLCDRVSRNTDAKLSVSNEYLFCRLCCIIEPTGFIMNKHT